ncbi:MAG: hypothetical protein R3288_03550 [Woeseiaceae bacterium]|nr:hypothetical protein [Woeseiaceae bacterium]
MRATTNRGVAFVIMALLLAAAAVSDEHAASPTFKRAVFLVSDLDRALRLWKVVLGFDAGPVTEYVGDDDYVFHLMNLPPGTTVRTVALSAGAQQVRTMALIEVRGLDALPENAPRRAAVVVNARGRLTQIIAGARAAGLRLTRENRFETVEGIAAIEQGIVDWDGNLILVYQLDAL